MSSDAEILAALFGKAEQADEPAAAPAPSTSDLDEEQRELVARYHLPPELVTRVRGGTWAEKCRDAEALAKLLPEQGSIKERARRHLRDGFAERKAERDRALVEMLHPASKDDEPSEQDQAEPTPDQQHAATIAAALAPGGKQATDEALVRSVHGGDEDGER